ncbi:MAG: hypothetical protein JSV10_11045 [Candidatus Zixiibacteriota bacterium]|nr:MAG: hypothetical protein JSV10_11045 [candidate division Zixibacteria bacterium]
MSEKTKPEGKRILFVSARSDGLADSHFNVNWPLPSETSRQKPIVTQSIGLDGAKW